MEISPILEIGVGSRKERELAELSVGFPTPYFLECFFPEPFFHGFHKVDDSGSECKGHRGMHTKQCISRHPFGCCSLIGHQKIFERALAWESKVLGSCPDSATNETLYDYEEATCSFLAPLPYL